MINLKPELRTSKPTTTTTTTNAFSFISRGWREVRESADADLQLMKNRANSFRNLANSFDRELENFVNSSAFSSVVPASPPPEIYFVKKLQPKLTEIRRAYSSPDFSRKVLEKWSPSGARIRIDLSAIKKAIVAEVDGEFDEDRARFWSERRKEEQEEDWEPIRAFKTRLRELERKSLTPSSPSELFEGFKNSEFVEKVNSSLRSIGKETQESSKPS